MNTNNKAKLAGGAAMKETRVFKARNTHGAPEERP